MITQVVRRTPAGIFDIDEQVAQITPGGDLRYVLQDANYNVVGIARACDGTLVRQFRYSPYGELTAVERIESGIVGPASTPETWHLFQGLWRDHDTGLDHARNRDYASWLGRFIAADMNQTGLIVANALAMNGQTQMAFASMSAGGQYSDGMNLYLFAGGNPITGRDPAGLFTYADLMATQAVQMDLIGQQADINVSSIAASLGIIAFANDRNAAIDRMLGQQSNPFDDSQIRSALGVWTNFQKLQDLAFGAIIAGAAINGGKLLYKFYSRRLAGKGGLSAMLKGGMTRVGRFFGFSKSKGRVRWIDEIASMSPAARNFDDGALGSRSNVSTRRSMAPQIEYVSTDGSLRAVRFDGMDGDILIDRKTSIVTSEKAKNQAMRQSEALQQSGYSARWEVPDGTQASHAEKMLQELGISNISVEIVNGP